MDCTVYGILQARILKEVAVPFSRESFQPRDWTQISRIAGGREVGSEEITSHKNAKNAACEGINCQLYSSLQ